MAATVLASGNQVVKTASAPLGPGGAAQGVVDGRGNLYTSLQYGVDVATGTLVSGGAAAQMKQAMTNIAAVFKAAQYQLDVSGASCWIYGFDAATFGNISSEYNTFFPNEDHHPSRSPTGATLVYENDALVGVSCSGFPNGGVRIAPPQFFSTDFNAQGLLVDGGEHLYTSAQVRPSGSAPQARAWLRSLTRSRARLPSSPHSPLPHHTRAAWLGPRLWPPGCGRRCERDAPSAV